MFGVSMRRVVDRLRALAAATKRARGGVKEKGDQARIARDATDVQAGDQLIERWLRLEDERDFAAIDRDRLVNELNRLVGERNMLVGERNVLVGDVNRLTGERNELVGERNALVGERNELVGERNALTQRLAEVQNAHNEQILEDDIQGSGPPLRGLAKGTDDARWPEPDRTASASSHFVIFSNMRSGSTYLQAALGSLPDVGVDFELKWGLAGVPSPVHIVLDSDPRSIREVLATVGPDMANVRGSKFVYDFRRLSRSEFRSLAGRLAGTRIIHLSRNYGDVLLSSQRGFFHLAGDSDLEQLGENLRSAIDAARPSPEQAIEPAHVKPDDCFRKLLVFLHNDLQMKSLAADFPYVRVDYSDLSERIPDLCRFVGSSAADEDITRVVISPAVLKLPSVPPESVISNVKELQPLFDAFETLRQSLVLAEPASGPS